MCHAPRNISLKSPRVTPHHPFTPRQDAVGGAELRHRVANLRLERGVGAAVIRLSLDGGVPREAEAVDIVLL